jgi:regulator of sigma E protease
VPRKNPPKGQGPMGVEITNYELKTYPFYLAPIVGVWESLKISAQFYQELGKLLFRLVTLQKPQVDVTGPVGIAKLTDQAVKAGIEEVIQLLAFLSLNLALINILPFPALDGGQLVFVAYEGITKRKINEAFKAKVNTLGFAFLLFLLLLITFKDIQGLLK